jgi:hypothetical protein
MFTTELQYVVVRYMLNELGDEAANVGIIAVTNDPPNVIAQFLPDPTVKSRSDTRVNRDVVDRFEAFAKAQVAKGDLAKGLPATESVFARLREIGGSVVRIGFPRSVLTNDVQKEFQLLFGQLVAPASSNAARREQGPRDPLGGLRREAASAVVRAFREGYDHSARRAPYHRDYEVQGAIHKNVFDLAVTSTVKRKPTEHLFHHLLVLADVEESFTQAAALSWRWSDIHRANQVDRQLTAVLYERGTDRAREIPDTTRLLRNDHIEVAQLDELPSLVRKLEDQRRLF